MGRGRRRAAWRPLLQQSTFYPVLKLIASFHIVTAAPGQVVTTSGIPVATVTSTTAGNTVVVETISPTTTDNSENSSSSSSSGSSSSGSSSSGLSTADLVGIIVSAVGAVATIIFGIVQWRQGRKKNKTKEGEGIRLDPVYHPVPPMYQPPPPPQRPLWNPWYS
jgi:hypothetical protein